MSVAFMRPVQEEDFEQIYQLALKTGGGMTNLPMDKKALRTRIDFTLDCFSRTPSGPGGEVYMLVLEKDGAVLGTSAIFASIGEQSGFVNYRINTMFHFSEQLGKRISRRLLVPTHDLTGAAEVGSLFIAPEARKGGYGKLMARSRYMFIAQSPEIIADRICAELRGWRAENGGQPFWEAVGRHFFDMEFEAADQHNSIAGNQFIADLMPIYPLYIALLPEDARACIGKPHKSSLIAYNMLLEEGFTDNGYIDVFDAGPLVIAKTSELRTVTQSMIRTAKLVDKHSDISSNHQANLLIANGKRDTYRCIRANVGMCNDYIYLSRDEALALQCDDGSPLRCTAA